MSTETISWHAPEFRDYHKTYGWYAAAVAVTVLLVGFFLIQNDIFAAVTMGLIGLIAILFARKKPEIVNIELNSKGVKFGNILFPYKQIKYFWVVDNDRHKSVIFHTNTFLNNTIILELGDQNSDAVRNFLLAYLPEHTEDRETPIQRLMHKLKF
jgi:hypothetical protein